MEHLSVGSRFLVGGLFMGICHFMVGGRRSISTIHINGQYRSDDTYYTKIGILSRTKRGPFVESHERQSTVKSYG